MGPICSTRCWKLLTDRIQELSGGQALMAILSNLATRSLVSARCAIDFKVLSRNPEEAIEIAHRMELKLANWLGWILTVQPLITREFLTGLMPLVLQQAMTGGPSKQEPMPMPHKVVLTKAWVTGQVSRRKKNSMEESPYQCQLQQKWGSIGLNQRFQLATVCWENPSAIELACTSCFSV